MVTPTQARQQISQVQQVISTKQDQFNQALSKARSINTDSHLSQRQLRSPNRNNTMRVKSAEVARQARLNKEGMINKLEAEKASFLQDIQPIQEEISSAEGQIRAVESAIQESQDWQKALDYSKQGVSPSSVGGKSSSVGSKLLQIYENSNAYNEYLSNKPALELSEGAYQDLINRLPDSPELLEKVQGRMVNVMPELKRDFEVKDFDVAIDQLEQERINLGLEKAEIPKEGFYTKIDRKVGGYLPGAIKPTHQWYHNSEAWAKKKITQPIGDFIHDKTGLTPEKVGKFMGEISYDFVAPGSSLLTIRESKLRQTMKPFRDFQAGVAEGFIEGIRDKPIKTTLTTASFFVLPGALGAVGKVASPAVKSISALKGGATALKVGGSAVKVGLPTLYGASVGKRIIQTPGGAKEKGQTTGEIISTEVAPMLIGGFAGAKATQKLSGWWRTRGRTEIPTEKLVIKDVRTGKKTFVDSSSYGYKGKLGSQKQKFDVKIFKDKGEMYHSTGEQFWGTKPIKIGKGSAEFEGLYGAPSPSTYFLRTGAGKTSLYGGKLLEPYKNPGVAKITPKRFDTAKVLSTGRTGKAGSLKFAGKLKEGVAYVSGVKPEIEAIIPYSTNTQLIKIGGKTYFKLDGQRIPIDTFITSGSSGRAGINPIGSTLKTIFSSYSVGQTPITTPGSYLLGSMLNQGADISTSKTSIKSQKTNYEKSLISPSSKKSSSYKIKPVKSILSPAKSSKSNYKPTKSSVKYLSSSDYNMSSYKPSHVSSSRKPTSSKYSSSKSKRSSYAGSSYKRNQRSSTNYFIPQKQDSGKPKRVYKKKSKKRDYVAEVRRFGVWKPVSNEGMLKEVYGKGLKKVRKTLGVSLRVRQKSTGKIINIPTPQDFLPSKKDKGVIIEKRGQRLKKRSGETAEIQFFKKMKSKPKKLNNMFF